VSALALWWLSISLLGWLCWPLVAAIFARTPGRGYAYARALGLLLLSYLYWLLGVTGLLPNTTAALWGITGLCAIGGLIFWVWRWSALNTTLRREWRHILTVELLFVGLYLLYVAHRAYDPAISHTEQPMDFAFLNGILRSPRLPPRDPWLSGFNISYYYFGYLTVAVLVRLTGVSAGVGYNLGLAHTLALTVVGGYGVIYDLTLGKEQQPSIQVVMRPARIWGIVGGLAMGFVSNLEGLFELLRTRGWGSESFYAWLNVPDLITALPSGVWIPTGRWWWWRASRIIMDDNFLGKTPTVITEFPSFSFILGDLHPHVMALPYVLLALGLATELYHMGRHGGWRHLSLALAPLLLGALGFLNSWDLPTFLLIAGVAYSAGRWHGRVLWRTWLHASVIVGAWLLVGSVLLYLPFWRHLNSQAQGIGLAYYAKTPLKHYILCLGPWLLPILADAGMALGAWRKQIGRMGRWRTLLGMWAVVWALPWLGTALLGGWGRLLLAMGPLIISGPWTLLLQSGLLTVLLASLWQALGQDKDRDHTALLGRVLVLVGISLTYGAEFFYLRDLFDTRMNTVFKLYYQAWVLLGIGATLAAWRLWRAGSGWRASMGASALILTACLYYPVAAAYTRGDGYQGTPALDGTAYLRQSPAEYGAFAWLHAHARPEDVLVEAPGQEYYADHNRLSAWTGVPTILGWAGHEAQWRGNEAEPQRRIPDLERIYTSPNQNEVMATLRRYDATYLYIGPYEQEKYTIGDEHLDWYASFLQVAYAEGDVRLYRVPD
jgi:YYY domain-containing protein